MFLELTQQTHVLLNRLVVGQVWHHLWLFPTRRLHVAPPFWRVLITYEE